MKDKKNPEVATGGFEPASQLPPAKIVRPLTSGPYGAVFIMNIQRYIGGKMAQTSIQNHFALSPCLFTLGLYCRPLD